MKLQGFNWDSGNWPKCGKHGLSKAEIEFVFENGAMITPDRSKQDAEIRFNAIGKNEDGRYIFVAFTFREVEGLNLIRPISSRYMHKKEIKNYER